MCHQLADTGRIPQVFAHTIHKEPLDSCEYPGREELTSECRHHLADSHPPSEISSWLGDLGLLNNKVRTDHVTVFVLYSHKASLDNHFMLNLKIEQ